MEGGEVMVYVISDGNGHCKIGSTADIETRIKELQTGNPHNLKLLYTIGCYDGDFPSHLCLRSCDVEKLLHRYFKQYKLRAEWFLEDPVVDFFERTDPRGFDRFYGICDNHYPKYRYDRIRFRKRHSNCDFSAEITDTYYETRSHRKYSV